MMTVSGFRDRHLIHRLDEKVGELGIVARRQGRRIAFHIMDHEAELSARAMNDTRQFPTINARNPTSTIDDLQWTTLPFVILFLPLALSTPRPLVHRTPDGHRNYNNDERP